MKHTTLTLLLSLLMTTVGFSQERSNNNADFPILKGPYLGQTLPGPEPELFAPGIVSNGLPNRDVAITPDGSEIYYGTHTADFRYAVIFVTRLIDGKWTVPGLASFSVDPRYIYLEPALSYDGERLFFFSNMPKNGTSEPADEDIWVVDRNGKLWGEPYNLGHPVNTEGGEFYPSPAQNGNLYFTRADPGERINYIYLSKFVDGQYTLPEKLPEQVNCGTNRFNAYVSPDESYIVVSATGMADGLGGADYYIVFRNPDGSWQEPRNMGPDINSATGSEWSFYVSPDQKFIFFMATRGLPEEEQPRKLSRDFIESLQTMPQNGSADIYWMESGVIDKLRNAK